MSSWSLVIKPYLALCAEGIVFEDPTGEVFPWRMGEMVSEVRMAMDVCGWSDGQLLIHIHHAYGTYVERVV